MVPFGSLSSASAGSLGQDPHFKAHTDPSLRGHHPCTLASAPLQPGWVPGPGLHTRLSFIPAFKRMNYE